MPTSVALLVGVIALVTLIILEHRNRQRPSIFDHQDPKAMRAEEREWRIG